MLFNCLFPHQKKLITPPPKSENVILSSTDFKTLNWGEVKKAIRVEEYQNPPPWGDDDQISCLRYICITGFSIKNSTEECYVISYYPLIKKDYPSCSLDLNIIFRSLPSIPRKTGLLRII